jgi:hypothetical protein
VSARRAFPSSFRSAISACISDSITLSHAMEKSLQLRFAKLAAYKKLFWPVSIRRPVLFLCGVALLVVGVACVVVPHVAVLLEFIEKYNGAFTALATIAVAWFTWTLRQSTDKLWRISERALTELEAPVISIKIVNTGFSLDLLKTSFTGGTLKYAFVNYGRTAATLFEIVDDIRIIKTGEGYPPHIKSERGPPLPYGVFIPPNGETEPFNFNAWATMLGLASEPNALRAAVPFFLGTARYGDIFGNIYTMGFCFMFDDVGNRFIEAGGPDHRYCHKERGAYRPPGSNRRR